MRILAKYEDAILRIAVAVPLLWAGVRELVNPNDWIGFVPLWVGSVIDIEAFLVAHGFVLIIAAAGILFGFLRAFFSAVAFAVFAGILIFYGVDDITFRDIGLALVSLVLFIREL